MNLHVPAPPAKALLAVVAVGLDLHARARGIAYRLPQLGKLIVSLIGERFLLCAQSVTLFDGKLSAGEQGIDHRRNMSLDRGVRPVMG
ncbi:hypothetical protein SAMN05216337_102013 [Bradyrhizobium brasilense]|uniref:Transposase n=1 Tax=Bradyrhizobium brasilense TaxID=1419277 RepID=A0A1G7A7C0_9BRAD|nr:hypothetical protein SAMN05216337_102013 [Bradyrhizobium brasilense]